MKQLRLSPKFGSSFYLEDIFMRPSIEPQKYRIMQGYAYRAWLVLLDYFNRDERMCHAQYQRRVSGLVSTYETLPEFSVTRSGKRYSTNHLDAMYTEFELMEFYDRHLRDKSNVKPELIWDNPAVVSRAAYALMFLLNLLRSTDSRLDSAGAIRDESWGRSIVLIHPMRELQRITGMKWPSKLFLTTAEEVHTVERMMELKSRINDLDWFKESEANLPSKWRSSLIGYARRNLRNDPGNPFQKAFSEAIPTEIYTYLTETFLDCEGHILIKSEVEDAVTLRILGEINSKVELVTSRIYEGSAMEAYRGFLSTRSLAHKNLKAPLSTLGLSIVREWFQGQKNQELVDLVIRDLERFQEWRYPDAKLKHVLVVKADQLLAHLEWPFATFSHTRHVATTGQTDTVELTVYTSNPIMVVQDKFVSDQGKVAVVEEVGGLAGPFTSYVTDVRGESHFWDNKTIDALRDTALRALHDMLMEYQFEYECKTQTLTDIQKDEVKAILARIRALSNYSVEVPHTLLSSFITFYNEDGLLTKLRPVDIKPLGGDFVEVNGKFATFDGSLPTAYTPVVNDHWNYIFDVRSPAVALAIDPVVPLEQLIDVSGSLTVIEPQDIEANLFVNGLNGMQFYGRKVMTSRRDAAQMMFPNLRWADQVVRVFNACMASDIFENIKPALKDIVRNWLARLPSHLHKVGRHYTPELIDALAKLATVDQRYVYYRNMRGRKDLLELLAKWVPTYLFGDLFGESLSESTVPFQAYSETMSLVATKQPDLEPAGVFKTFRLAVKEFVNDHILDPKFLIPADETSKS